MHYTLSCVPDSTVRTLELPVVQTINTDNYTNVLRQKLQKGAWSYVLSGIIVPCPLPHPVHRFRWQVIDDQKHRAAIFADRHSAHCVVASFEDIRNSNLRKVPALDSLRTFLRFIPPLPLHRTRCFMPLSEKTLVETNSLDGCKKKQDSEYRQVPVLRQCLHMGGSKTPPVLCFFAQTKCNQSKHLLTEPSECASTGKTSSPTKYSGEFVGCPCLLLVAYLVLFRGCSRNRSQSFDNGTFSALHLPYRSVPTQCCRMHYLPAPPCRTTRVVA